MHLHLQVRLPKQLHTRLSMVATIPVTPEERSRTHPQWMRASRSPGAASRWCCHSIDTARATGKDDNCAGWLHRRCAGCHQLPCAARLPQATGQLDSVTCHLVERQSLAPRSDQPSRAEPPPLVHIPVREPAGGPPVPVDAWTGEQMQTRSSAPDQDEADDPAPAGGSRPIG